MIHGSFKTYADKFLPFLIIITQVEIYGFYIQWSKVVQHVTTSNEGNQRHKYLQNYDEKLDMGKHPFILVITISNLI